MKTLFGVKDYEATYENHKSRFTKMVEVDLVYQDIIDKTTEEVVLSNVINSTFYKYGFWRNLKSQKVKTRMLAKMVNDEMRDYISRTLPEYGLSKWYATAFYIKYYSRVNELMLEILDQIPMI